jgi:hypothetical protein
MFQSSKFHHFHVWVGVDGNLHFFWTVHKQAESNLACSNLVFCAFYRDSLFSILPYQATLCLILRFQAKHPQNTVNSNCLREYTGNLRIISYILSALREIVLCKIKIINHGKTSLPNSLDAKQYDLNITKSKLTYMFSFCIKSTWLNRWRNIFALIF